jgi:hypothetical protein
VTTTLYITGTDDFAQLASTLPSCLGQAACAVQIVTSDSCATSLMANASSNCSADSQPVFACKGFVVAPELYNAANAGQCTDDWQRSSVQCPSAQLQRSLYNAIMSGKCAAACSATQGPQQAVGQLASGGGRCARVQLRVSAASFSAALRQKQATLAGGLDALNACWANGGRSWQVAALEAPGELQSHACKLSALCVGLMQGQSFACIQATRRVTHVRG